MKHVMHTIDNLAAITLILSIIATTVGWFVIFPTVGLLYCFGVLP